MFFSLLNIVLITASYFTARAGQYAPFWNTTIPDLRVNKSAGLRPINERHFTIYNTTTKDGSKNPNGTYNNGPIITYFNNLFYVSWYNAPQHESQNMRVLLSTSSDAVSWNEPFEVFPNFTSIGTSNDPFTILNDRLYTAGLVSTENDKTFLPALMRQIFKNNSFGEIFWLNLSVPDGFEYLGYKTYLEMNNDTVYDMKMYFGSQISTINVNESNISGGGENERSMYLIPSTLNSNRKQLMLLMRTSSVYQHEFYSTCFIEQNVSNVIVANNNLFSCRPQGNKLNLVDIVHEYADAASKCDWSHAIETNIPDAPSRTCASTLHDGRIYLLGNQLSMNNTSNNQTRNVLMLTISNDGFNFNQTWAVRYSDYSEGSTNQALAFDYPGGMWNVQRNNLYVTYSVNKKDIEVSVISLDDIK